MILVYLKRESYIFLLCNWPVCLSVPSFSALIDQESHEVRLQVNKADDSPYPLEMCLQHEDNGVCRVRDVLGIHLNSVNMQQFSQTFTLPSDSMLLVVLQTCKESTVPLHSVTPCMCFQVLILFPLIFYLKRQVI